MARLVLKKSFSACVDQLTTEFFNTDSSKLGECEFFLISEMNSQLIVHHPYRSLTALQNTFSLTTEESNLAWSIINDHYMTDLPLMYAPHITAITAILLALVLRPTTSPGQSASHNTLGGSSANNIAVLANVALSSAHTSKNSLPAEKAGGAVRSKVQMLSSWLAESNIDIEALVDCTQEMISFYEAQEQYNEKLTKDQINRFVKARNLDK